MCAQYNNAILEQIEKARHKPENAQFDNEILEAERRIVEAKDKAETMLIDFKQTISACLTESSEYLINNAMVLENPERTLSIGSETLSQIKKQLSEIVLFFPDCLEKNFDKIAWVHRDDFSEEEGLWAVDAPIRATRKTTDSIDKLICQLLGQIGSILIKHGFASITDSISSTWRMENGQVEHSDDLDFSDKFPERMKLKALNKRYQEIITGYIKATAKRIEAQDNLILAQAQYLWSRA